MAELMSSTLKTLIHDLSPLNYIDKCQGEHKLCVDTDLSGIESGRLFLFRCLTYRTSSKNGAIARFQEPCKRVLVTHFANAQAFPRTLL